MGEHRTRRMWTDILPAWDHAHRAATSGQATPAQRAVLEAVLWLLARHQRTEDTVRLTQVAYEAGMWDGTDTCPRWTSAAVGRHLQALADLEAIVYEPSTSRRGCLITLIQPDHGSRAQDARPDAAERAADTRERTNGSRAQTARANGSTRAHSTTRSRASDRQLARKSPRTRAPGARASEGFPEVPTEGKPEGRAAHDSASAPSAARADVERVRAAVKTAAYETDAPDDHVELVLHWLDTGPADAIPLACHALDLTGDAIAGGPSGFVARLERMATNNGITLPPAPDLTEPT